MYGAARVIALDLDPNRLDQAMGFGATDTVNSGDPDWAEQVRTMTDGLGVDVAIEAVGIPNTFEACLTIVRPGGSVANVGVHGTSVDLPLQDLWIMDIAITMRAAIQASVSAGQARCDRRRPNGESKPDDLIVPDVPLGQDCVPYAATVQKNRLRACPPPRIDHDHLIQGDVMQALALAPQINDALVGVSVLHGIGTFSGEVS